MESNDIKPTPTNAIKCWCGAGSLPEFSPDYALCKECGTLVSTVGLGAEEIAVANDDQDFYGKDYWLGHQVKDLGNPDIHERARADMPERCMHWLQTLLRYQQPPAKVLEIGAAHGGFVALMRSIGYDATGLELSPWIVDFARHTFAVPMLQGPIEGQPIPGHSLDAIVMSDVVEHLPDPLATLGHCAHLLKDNGILVIQMPSYPDGVSYDQLRQRNDRFLEHMDGKGKQHLNLFSPRAARMLCDRLGFGHVDFVRAIFDYDMYFVSSRQPLVRHTIEDLAPTLTASPAGRITLAWLELLMQSEAREADRAARLDVILRLDAALRASEKQTAPFARLANRLRTTMIGRGLRYVKHQLVGEHS